MDRERDRKSLKDISPQTKGQLIITVNSTLQSLEKGLVNDW